MSKSRLELSSVQYQKMFKELGFDKYSVIREAKLNLMTVDVSMDRITKMCNWAYAEGQMNKNDPPPLGVERLICSKNHQKVLFR